MVAVVGIATNSFLSAITNALAALGKKQRQRKNTMKLNKAAQAKVGKVMHEYGQGKLHSGKGGKTVTNQKQAVAISISEAAKLMKKRMK